jgi:hypothetical protein
VIAPPTSPVTLDGDLWEASGQPAPSAVVREVLAPAGGAHRRSPAAARQNGGVTEPPFLRVVRGEPTAEELAALVAVLAARAAAGAGGRPRPRSAWADPATRLRMPLRPGPAAWRRSALPG